jgi:hypothetical protein
MNQLSKLTKSKVLWGIIGIAALITIIVRLLPHIPNFVPIGALALFVGTYLAKKPWQAIAIPLYIMLVSDILLQLGFMLGFFEYAGFYSGIWLTYLAFALMVGVGTLYANRVNVATVLGGTIIGSILFFLLTNFGVWVGSGMYEPKSIGTLIECYGAAVPFFRSTFASNILYSGILYGSFELAKHYYIQASTQVNKG